MPMSIPWYQIDYAGKEDQGVYLTTSGGIASFL